MLRRSFPIMFILLIVFLLVLPAAAQDVTPESTPTVIVTPAPVMTDVPVVTPAPVEAPTPFNQIMPWLGAIAIVGLIIAGVLGKAFIIQIGSSVPVAFYEITKGAAVSGLDQLGHYVTTTETTIDDQGYAELRKLFDELKAEIEAKRQEQLDLIQRYISNPPTSSSAN